ncbi:MAG: hypothetical protein J6J78_09815 [Clostridia bacterium]|nr:hypothetical protein [Clostridia bacterium]MBP3653348.1 hypothetical protein [Clostridia bacterium]
MNSKAYILGFLCGLAVVVIAGLVLRYIFKKKCLIGSGEYDERQKAIQGTGYKYAYFTALAVILVGGIVESMLNLQWCSLMMLALLGLWISICVFITYCVIRDAYFSLRSRRKHIMIILLIASLVNLGIGLRNTLAYGIIENGQLGLNATNLLTGLCCIYLAAMMLVRTIWERRQEDAE